MSETHSFKVEEVVQHYMILRQQKKAMEESFAAQLEPITKAMGVIENWLLDKMNAEGVDSMKTPAGTPYKSTRSSMSLGDKQAFMRYVLSPFVDGLAETVGLPADRLMDALMNLRTWELVDLRAGKKAIDDHIDAGGELPPGVKRSMFTTVNVRAN